MKYISVADLNQMLTSKEDVQIIDVRESYEFEDENIGGINIPLAELLNQTDKIEKNKTVILCCKSGKRSAAMTLTLERKFGMNNVVSLKGGLESYYSSIK